MAEPAKQAMAVRKNVAQITRWRREVEGRSTSNRVWCMAHANTSTAAKWLHTFTVKHNTTQRNTQHTATHVACVSSSSQGDVVDGKVMMVHT
jgi:hypothetical protein